MTQPPSEQPTRRPPEDDPDEGQEKTSDPTRSTDGASGERNGERGDAESLPTATTGAISSQGQATSNEPANDDEIEARESNLDFTDIVPRFESALLRYVGQLLRPNDPEVEDIVQDAFLRLHRYVGKHGDGAVRNVQTWLYKVAHNLTMDTLRKRKVRKDGQERVVRDAVESGTVDGLQADPARDMDPSLPREGHGVDALGQLEHREACQHALDELHRLPEHQKEAVLLKLMQGLTIRQISEITGVSIGNVGYRINQGLAELSRRLKTAGVI